MSNDQVTLKKGDYVSTAGMTEDQYHAVARAFMAAGASAEEYGKYPHNVCDFFGWANDLDEPEGLFHCDGPYACHGRQLTPVQVLNATNAGNKEEDMTPCEKLGYKVGDRFVTGHGGAAGFSDSTEIILMKDDGTDRPLFAKADNLSFDQFCYLSSVAPAPRDVLTTTLQSAREEADKASEHDTKAKHHAAEHDRLMQRARDMLPDGWRLVRAEDIPDRPSLTIVDGQDVSDPANWREGDVGEVIDGCEDTHNFDIGAMVRLTDPHSRNAGEDAAICEGLEGGRWWVLHKNLRFHHRPT